MNVTAMLAWYDEPPELLAQAVRSVACVADSVVAVDGGWKLCPGATPESPVEQADAIREAAADVGLVATVLDGGGALWDGQVHKRDVMLQAAAERADWVMPLDADWIVTGNRDDARSHLLLTGAEAVRVRFDTPMNDDRPLAVSAATDWHEQLAGTSHRFPLIYRVLDRMRVEKYHWGYTGFRADGTKVAYWAPGLGETAVTDDINADLRIEHLCLFRDEDRISRNREFCAARAGEGFER